MKKIVSVFIFILFAINAFAQVSSGDDGQWETIVSKFNQIQQMFTSQESVSYEKYQIIEEELLQLLRKTERNQNYAAVIGHLARFNKSLGHFDRAVMLGTEAMDIAKKVFGNEHQNYAATLHNLAEYYSITGDYNKSIRLETEAMEIAKKTLGTQHPNYIMTLGNLANYYSVLGNFQEAIRLGAEAMQICKKTLGSEHPHYATYLANLASYHSDLGNYYEAIRLGTEAMEIRKKVLGSEHPDYITSLNNLANYYSNLGEHNKAIRLVTEAVEICKRVLGTEHLHYASYLANLANIYSNLGDFNDAIRLGTEALEVRRRMLGTEHPDYAESLDNLALDYSNLGDFNEAIRLETEALGIRRSMLGTEHPNYALSLISLANCYDALGNHNEAIRLGTEALEINKKALGREHPNYFMSLINLASYYSNQGNHNEAIRLGTEAMEISKSVLGADHPDYTRYINSLALCYESLGDFNEALRLFKTSIDLSTNNLLTQFSTLSSREREYYWNTISFEIGIFYPWLVSKTDSSEYFGDLYNKSALFAKGLLLNTDSELSRFIEASGNTAIIGMYQDLKQIRFTLNRLYEKPIAERALDTDSLEREAKKLETDLMRVSKTYGDYTRNLRISWQDVQNTLDENDIAVEFLSYYDRDINDVAYCALVLKKEYDSPKMIKLFCQDEYLEALQDNDIGPSLTALVWAPILDELEDVKDIYFSPSASLHHEPIESFALKDGTFMSEHFNLYRLSSTRQLVTDTKDIKITNATIYGGLDYDATSNELLAANKGISNSLSYGVNSDPKAMCSLEESSLRAGAATMLEGSRREAEFITKELQGAGISSTVYKDNQGTEDSFKALSGCCPTLIHIGTHGFYWTPDEAEQRKEISDNLRFLEMNERKVPTEDKAMTRSGLMMAGCNRVFNNETLPDSIDDGILTAKEISTLDLRGLNLVVLSACETALGDISGSEGVFGLQRAFKKAGAQAIMMSLWKVDDVATENMMKFFYTHLAKGEPIRQSFIAAQQEFRSIDPDPNHWAAFILLDALE